MRKKVIMLLTVLLLSVMVISPWTVQASTFNIDFPLNSKAAILVNLDTDTVVFEQKADEKVYPASMTKIMTFIVAYEHIEDLNGTIITVPQKILDELSGTDSSMSGIKAGEQLTAFQLLNLMMVHSGNDSAMVLADYVGGGDTGKFVDMMNQKAQELGCKDTHFVNPHGLSDQDHYTTARDLYKIIKYARTLKDFMPICEQKTYEVPATNKNSKRTIGTTNQLMMPGSKYYYEFTKGIKTGTTDESGYCFSSTAVNNGYSYLCIVFGAPSVDDKGKAIADNGAFIDTKKLYQWAFANLQQKQILKKDSPVGEVKLEYAWNKDKLLLQAATDFSTILPKTVDASSVIVKTNIPEKIQAPVKKGDVIGTATLSYANQDLTTVNLVASESVDRSELLYAIQVAKGIVTSTWFIIAACVIVGLILLYIILAMVYNRRSKNMRKVKKYRKF